MKISLYPTADGCYRPSRVTGKIRDWLVAGHPVGISSRDVSLTGIEGVVEVGRIEDLLKQPIDQPRYLVVDALDFSCPDGQRIIHRQQSPPGQPGQVAGDDFISVLLALSKGVTEEVILVCTNCDISNAWFARLDDLRVKIHWDTAASDPWRHWTRVQGRDDIRRKAAGIRLGPLADPGNTAITCFFHSARSQLLLTLAAEYSDIHLSESGRKPPVEPVNVLVRMLAGKPVSDRLELYGHLLDDLRLLSLMVQDLSRTLKGQPPSSLASTASGKVPASTPMPGKPKRTLH